MHNTSFSKSTIYANVNKLSLAFIIPVRTQYILVVLSKVFEEHIWLYIMYIGEKGIFSTEGNSF